MRLTVQIRCTERELIYDVFGKLRHERDKTTNQLLMSYEYDYADSGKHIKMTRTMEGDSAGQYAKETSYIDNLGNIVKKQQYDTGSTVYTSEYTYDYLGNVLTERSPRANVEKWENPSATYEYDYAGRCVSVQNAEGNAAYTTYDSLGRKRSETDFNQHAVNYEYDTLGRAIKQSTVLDTVNGIELAHTKLIAYDNSGNVTAEWTSNNKAGEAVSYDKVAYEYTGKNQLAKTAAYKDQNSAEYTQYDYDAAGNLVRLYTGLSSPLTIHGLDSVSGGSEYSVTKYEYDYLNRLIKTTDALGQAETYVPNYNGGIDQKTDRNGNVTTNTYDEFAQILKTEVTKPDGSMDRHAYVYNRLGQAVSVDGVSYEYDNLGRVIKETQDSTVKEYTYDGDGTERVSS